MTEQPIALFDVDGTLVPTNTWATLLAHPRLGQAAKRRVMLQVLPVWLAGKLKLSNDEAFRQRWVQAVAGLLRGWSRAETNALFDWVAGEGMAGAFRAEVVGRLEQHVARGDVVLLVSGMYAEMVAAFARQVGARAGIGSTLVYDGDSCTGWIDGVGCNGPHKLTFIKRYLAANGLTADWQASAAYADSYSDVPMLSAVGKAVVTYPEPTLYQYATAQGWEVIGTPTP